ncbi:MAG: type II toxin-antitoxin system VapC family toxin [Pirellulaceae bacterium]
MKAVFADTVFFVVLLSADDQYHDQAIRLSGTIRSPILTTEFVLLEVANALSSAFRRQSFSNLWSQLNRDPSIRIMPATSELFSRGHELYESRRDKDWSLTDCISFVVMETEKITDALTADHHFEQAGFVCMMK